jgi:competence protein ComEA
VNDFLERYRWLIVALLAVPLLSGIGFLLNERLSDDPAPIVVSGPTGESGEIGVYVSGAVASPGVYTLEDGDRWIDAIEAAGGFAEGADQAGVNLARRAEDEDQVLVPLIGAGVVAGASQGPQVNINTASQAELETLPGIGAVRAAAIIEARTAGGAFASTDELLSRELVPQSVYDDIQALVVVGP